MTQELAPAVQIQLFEPVGHELAGRIRNLNQLRPIEALKLLHDLQQELELGIISGQATKSPNRNFGIRSVSDEAR